MGHREGKRWGKNGFVILALAAFVLAFVVPPLAFLVGKGMREPVIERRTQLDHDTFVVESLRWDEDSKFYRQGLSLGTEGELPVGMLSTYGGIDVLKFKVSQEGSLLVVDVSHVDGQTVIEGLSEISLAGKQYQIKITADKLGRTIVD